MEYNEVIRNVSTNQKEIIMNIINMHNNGNPFDVDITYSTGGFYKKKNSKDIEVPEPIIKFDVVPQLEDVVKIEPWGPLPLEDESVSSIMFDPPFVCGPRTDKPIKEGSCIISKRFSSYYPMYELHESYHHWINEAYRVLKEGGIFVVKCQNTISSSRFYANEEYTWLEAEKTGFTTLDKFNLSAKSRLLSGQIKEQQHARNYNSVFWVFQKDKKKKVDYYLWEHDEKSIAKMKEIKEKSV